MPETTNLEVAQVGTHDVLIGRGTGPNVNSGNVRFRQLIADRKAEYRAIDPRDHKNKNRIAKEVINIISSRGGRFLRRVELSPGNGFSYQLVDATIVLEKAKQAMRQKRSCNGPGKDKDKTFEPIKGTPVEPYPSKGSGEKEKGRAVDKESTASAIADTGHQSIVEEDVDAQDAEEEEERLTQAPPNMHPEFVTQLQQQANPAPNLAQAAKDLHVIQQELQQLRVPLQQQQPPRNCNFARQAQNPHQTAREHDTSRAEMAIRNLQVQNYKAQQQHQRIKTLQTNSALAQNPHLPRAGERVDPGKFRNPLAAQHSSPGRTMLEQPNRFASTAPEDSNSDYIRFHLEQQLKRNLHVTDQVRRHTESFSPRNESRGDPHAIYNRQQAKLGTVSPGLNLSSAASADISTRSLTTNPFVATAAAAAADADSHHLKQSLKNVLWGGADLTPGQRGQCNNDGTGLAEVGGPISNSQMRALEYLFVNASKSAPNASSRDSMRSWENNSAKSFSELHSMSFKGAHSRLNPSAAGSTIETARRYGSIDNYTKYGNPFAQQDDLSRLVHGPGGNNVPSRQTRERDLASQYKVNPKASNDQYSFDSHTKPLENMLASTRQHTRFALPHDMLTVGSGLIPQHGGINPVPDHLKSKRSRDISPGSKIIARGKGPSMKRHFKIQLNEQDVLCGHGPLPQLHRGNNHFQDLVTARKTEYEAIHPRDYEERNRIAREVIDVVWSRGGKFLVRVVVEVEGNEQEAFEVADEQTMMRKTMQSLQGKGNKSKETSIEEESKFKSKGLLVTELGKNDILCGCGSDPNMNSGNVCFHYLIAMRKSEYLATSDPYTKVRIAREIFETVLHHDGRFLRRILGHNGANVYDVVDTATAIRTTMEALQHGLDLADSRHR